MLPSNAANNGCILSCDRQQFFKVESISKIDIQTVISLKLKYATPTKINKSIILIIQQQFKVYLNKPNTLYLVNQEFFHLLVMKI